MLPLVTIVCDDTKTAVAYFRSLTGQLKHGVHVKIVPAKRHGASAEILVQQAIEVTRPGKAETADEPVAELDSTWLLLDTEGTSYQAAAIQSVDALALNAGIHLLISHPCFEVWVLAHLEDTGQHFTDCGRVLSRVKDKWLERFGQEMGRKSGADYDKLIDRWTDAAQRSEKHWNAKDPSRTEVFKLVNELFRLVKMME